MHFLHLVSLSDVSHTCFPLAIAAGWCLNFECQPLFSRLVLFQEHHLLNNTCRNFEENSTFSWHKCWVQVSFNICRCVWMLTPLPAISPASRSARSSSPFCSAQPSRFLVTIVLRLMDKIMHLMGKFTTSSTVAGSFPSTLSRSKITGLFDNGGLLSVGFHPCCSSFLYLRKPTPAPYQ